jgi:hypothetical protein
MALGILPYVVVEAPPKICEPPPKVVELEVVSPSAETHESAPPRAEKTPIHPLSAIALLAIDNLWMLEDWIAITWFITIPLSFLTVFFPVFFIQKFVNKDSFGRALAFASLLGVIAAVPTSLTGTPVGLGLLAWTGLGKLFGRTPRK